MNIKKIIAGASSGAVALSMLAGISLTSSADETPIHTFKTTEKVQENKTKTAADKITKANNTVWATAFADGSSAYSILSPWDNDLFDMKEIDGAEFVLKTTSNNLNGSIGFATGADYDWCQINFDLGPAIDTYWGEIEEGNITAGETFTYTDEDQVFQNAVSGDEYPAVIKVEITEDAAEGELSNYTYKFSVDGFQKNGLIGNTKGGEVKFAINGMNANCTEPTKNASNKYDWTELSTSADLVSYKLKNAAGEEIFDAADPDAHKIPAVEGSGKWTDKGNGAYAYAWAGAGQAVGLADVPAASVNVTIPEVEKESVRSLKAKVSKTGGDAEGQIGINATGDKWTTGSTTTTDGNITVDLPNGINDDKVTLQMFWIDHGTVLTISDLKFVLKDGTEVPFFEAPEESSEISSEDPSSEDASSEDVSSEVESTTESVVESTVDSTVESTTESATESTVESTSDSTVESTPDSTSVHTYITVETTVNNQGPSKAKPVRENGVTWSTKFKDGNSYDMVEPFSSGLYDPSKISSAKMTFVTKSDNFNGSLGFPTGEDYTWQQIDFKVEDAINEYRDLMTEGEIAKGDKHTITDGDVTVTVYEDEDGNYVFEVELKGIEALNVNQKAGEIKLQINGMNTFCTEPTDDPENPGKFTWTELATALDLTEFHLYDVDGNEIFDGSKIPDPTPAEPSVWTNNNDGSYSYTWNDPGQGVDLAEVTDAQLIIAAPEVDKEKVRKLTAKVEITGGGADGSIGVNAAGSGWQSVEFSKAVDGEIVIELPEGVDDDKATVKMYWCDHGATVKLSDISYVLEDGTVVPFPNEVIIHEDTSTDDGNSTIDDSDVDSTTDSTNDSNDTTSTDDKTTTSTTDTTKTTTTGGSTTGTSGSSNGATGSDAAANTGAPALAFAGVALAGLVIVVSKKKK